MADRPHIGIAGINRILNSVKPHSLANIDRDAFARGIDECVFLYEEAKKYYTQKLNTSQKRQLRTVLDRAERLEKLMKDESVWSDKLWIMDCDPAEHSPTSPRAAIQAIVRLVRIELQRRNAVSGYYQGTFRLRSPFEWLFGDWLVVVYKTAHFPYGGSLKDLVSKNGPYLRFAKAVAKELRVRRLGRPYANASYVKAIKGASSQKISRRKPWYEPYLGPGDGMAGFFEQGPDVFRHDLRLITAGRREGSWAKLK
jgi:hypothetical protein